MFCYQKESGVQYQRNYFLLAKGQWCPILAKLFSVSKRNSFSCPTSTIVSSQVAALTRSTKYMALVLAPCLLLDFVSDFQVWRISFYLTWTLTLRLRAPSLARHYIVRKKVFTDLRHGEKKVWDGFLVFNILGKSWCFNLLDFEI